MVMYGLHRGTSALRIDGISCIYSCSWLLFCISCDEMIRSGVIRGFSVCDKCGATFG